MPNAPSVVPGWERLRHGGLLFDGTRLGQLSQFAPSALDGYTEGQLRQRANAILDGSGDQARFVAFVLQGVCGLNASTGNWIRDRVMCIAAFLAQNDREGWMLPEPSRADYGLGHDDRATRPQPVASRLGPRFFDWQLVQSADESRGECHLHTRNLLGAGPYAMLRSQNHLRQRHEGPDAPETRGSLQRMR